MDFIIDDVVGELYACIIADSERPELQAALEVVTLCMHSKPLNLRPVNSEGVPISGVNSPHGLHCIIM